MTDDFEPVREADLPRRGPVTSAYGEVMAVGAEALSAAPCPLCGLSVLRARLNSGTIASFNQDGTLHASCGRDRELMPEPLPPVPTYEDQQRRLDQLLGKKTE